MVNLVVQEMEAVVVLEVVQDIVVDLQVQVIRLLLVHLKDNLEQRSQVRLLPLLMEQEEVVVQLEQVYLVLLQQQEMVEQEYQLQLLVLQLQEQVAEVLQEMIVELEALVELVAVEQVVMVVIMLELALLTLVAVAVELMNRPTLEEPVVLV